MNIVLLDRDGTLVVDPPDERVDSIQKVSLFPDVVEALSYLAAHDFAAIIITNQAGMAEGLMDEADFWRINEHVLRLLAPSGIRILKTYLNGEGQGVESYWRKPGPGMLLQAASDFNFDIADVYMVGDRATDVQAAHNAGCKGGILVKTSRIANDAPTAAFVADTLLDAVKFIVENT